ncbi:translocation/assembly module TamB domain-containing protein [Pseudomonas nitroreducens]|uniref:translocation/assembly module TamB domain-containing protein n=1 Tax=Pseudomonas nitroreducens TaxID=46680 RepID=UPI001FB6A51F|nr:translocation/assembly module TamB domain-containing protein [Pseudomonas nitroreducens]MCJ1877768.1 translocation/assembly module TamB [Pseudomonas nitroreducens]MCJ1896998.1 translocation/assembly module TamB [Pseudomonas nitroreducens]
MRALRWSLGGLLGLILLLVIAVAALLGTPAGSRAVLSWVPGLNVEGFDGRLAGGFSAKRLEWSDGATHLVLDQPQIDWSPACLLRMTLCLHKVVANEVLLTLPPSEPSESSGPIQLPDLSLPLSLELGDIRIGRFLLDGQEQLRDAKLAAHWDREGLHIDSVKLVRDGLNLSLKGLLKPTQGWPLEAEGTLGLLAPGEKPWTLRLQASGELMGHLKLQAQSSGYLNGTLEGDLQPLAENLPATALVIADGFKADASLPDTLTLNQLRLNASGNLKDGYQLAGAAVLPAEQSPVVLTLRGRVDAQGADIAALDLSAAKDQRVALTGRLDWKDAFAANAQLDWLDFPWRRLYPAIDEPPVSVHTFKAEVSYSEGAYLGNFDGAFKGPAGDFTLASPVSGNLSEVFLPSLKLVAGQGKAEGHLKVGFADAVTWDAALGLSDLDPAYWLEEMPGRLGGPLRSKGSLKGEALNLDANLDLQGRLRGQPAIFKANAVAAGQAWKVDGLTLQLGDNRISGQAALDQRLSGRLDIALNRLGQLWPQLFGKVSGQLDLAGTLKAPQGQLKLDGQRVVYADQGLRTLDLTASLDAAQRGRVNLTAQGLRSGDTDFGVLKLDGSGDLKRQQLALNLQGKPVVLDLGLDGDWNGKDWRGRLAKGDIQSGGQDWRLQQPARLERLADGRINLGAHCWASGPASLCMEDQRLMPDPRLRMHLREFPLDSLARWLPEDFAWKGKLDGDVQLDLPGSGPNGSILINANDGTLRIKEQEEWVDFPYQRLQLESRLTPRRIDTNLQFQGDKLGSLQAQVQLDPRPKNKPVNGTFSLNGLDISLARPFAPMVETLKGHLNGSGQISGGLLAPRVDGELRLSDSEVSGGDLPTRFEQLQVTARIAGEQVDLSGDWKAGENGNGSLSGRIAWASGLDVDVKLRGNRLPVTVEPYANLEVEPDLSVQMAGEKLAVSGSVQVPRGAITIRQLPPSTVKVSDDTVIVGAKQEPRSALALNMDIDVKVGSDKLTFSGFGLNAELAGQVHIGDNMDTRGELRLNNGRYRAYGQKLTIRRARLLFAGPIDQPFLDVEAIRKVDDVVAGLRLTGNAEQPRSEVFSEPAMSQQQALSYLVLGRPMSSGEDSNMLGEAALALGLAGSAPLTGEVAQRLGIQDFQLDTEGTGNSTSVVASGQLSDRLSLRYGVGVFEPANTIALRYLLSKKVYLEAASGLASSLDIFYKRDF